jgi:hypothetical protein
LQDPPKFTQIGIFGLKTNHLATLGWNYFRKKALAENKFAHPDLVSVTSAHFSGIRVYVG